MAELYDFLIARGVRLGIRRDLLRFSFHIYNNEAEIERVVGLCQDWLAHQVNVSGPASLIALPGEPRLTASADT